MRPVLLAHVTPQVLEARAQGRLEAREGEVEASAVQQGSWQVEHRFIPELRQARERRSARITQAEKLGRLVERLACGVVNGLAQQLVPTDVVNPHELSMPTRHEQRDEGKLRRVDTEERRKKVPF